MERVKEVLPLSNLRGRNFYYSAYALKEIIKELEDFLVDEEFMDSKEFAKSVMFTYEIKANNNVEGIKDEVSLIEKVIEDAKSINDVNRRNRIINLYRGYRYILSGLEINEDNVGNLYKILSKDLLNDEDKRRMGKYYREAPVYILNNGRLDDSMSQGIPEELVQFYMNIFFDYVNNKDVINSPTDYFIKSQIMHFYFVFIHPYFDINGRTSRTIAMWYLLNNDIYPYIIFNRGINFDGRYDSFIRKGVESNDISYFLKYMLEALKKQLEKQYVLHGISEVSDRKLSTIDYQTIEYFISMNESERNVLNFVTMYNRYNDKLKNKEIFESMILPLIDSGIFNVDRSTNKCMWDSQQNLVLSLNKSKLKDINLSKVSRINM